MQHGIKLAWQKIFARRIFGKNISNAHISYLFPEVPFGHHSVSRPLFRACQYPVNTSLCKFSPFQNPLKTFEWAENPVKKPHGHHASKHMARHRRVTNSTRRKPFCKGHAILYSDHWPV